MAEFIEQKISSTEIFKGKVITVTKDTVSLKNGHSSIREIVHHNGGAGILAINSNQEIALVRQFRYALGKEMIEIPAGKIEIGEKPLKTAVRELEEEAGLRAKSVIPFGSIVPTCGYCTEIIYLFLATKLEETAQNLDSDEFLTPFWLPLSKVIDMVLSGEIIDSKTSFAILQAKLLLNDGKLNY